MSDAPVPRPPLHTPLGWLRWLFFAVVIRPLVYVVLGLNVRGHEHLPEKGPALVVANHNSHLDTLVLMSLLSHQSLHLLRATAAADYFMKPGWLRWATLNLVGILPIQRKPGPGGERRPVEEVLAPIHAALEQGLIVIFFPEGTRGEPEKLQRFKSGLGHLCASHPEVPVVPIYMHGLGKALPRGDNLLVPHFLDIVVGEPRRFAGEPRTFVETVQDAITEMESDLGVEPWD